MEDYDDPIQQLIHYAMNVLPGISSIGTAKDTSQAVLNTFFNSPYGIKLLKENQVFLETFGIRLSYDTEEVPQHTISFEYKTGTMAFVNIGSAMDRWFHFKTSD